MKRWIFSFFVFPIALFISLFAFHLFNSPEANIEVFATSGSTESDTIATNARHESNPEFTNLPDPYSTTPDWNERFIDTYQVGNVFRESEATARQGQSWFVLYERENKYELVNTKARIKKLNTYSWGDERDVRLTFDEPGVPVFAVRNFKSIRSGEITTLFQKPSYSESDRRGLNVGSMKSEYQQEFFLEDKRYLLRLSKGQTTGGEELTVLVLETGTKKQIVFSDSMADGELELGNLLWVGDLDQDGQLDLLIEPYSEKGGYSSFLFISSEAENGDLVKLSAAFGLAGC